MAMYRHLTSYNLYYVKYRYFVAFQATITVQAKSPL